MQISKTCIFRFAQRAKAVKNKPKVNEIMNEAALTKKYAKECSEIKKLLDVEFEKNKQLEVSNKIIKYEVFYCRSAC